MLGALNSEHLTPENEMLGPRDRPPDGRKAGRSLHISEEPSPRSSEGAASPVAALPASGDPFIAPR